VWAGMRALRLHRVLAVLTGLTIFGALGAGTAAPASADPPPGYCVYTHPVPPYIQEIVLCTP